MIGNKGLTLLEVMIAISILAIGMLGMLSLSSTSHRILALSEQKSQVAQLARNKMEGLRAKHPSTSNGEEEVADTGITRQWTIVQSEDDPNLWIITVTAFPTKEPARSILLKSLLFY